MGMDHEPTHTSERGPPECQDPDCSAEACESSGWQYCWVHNPERLYSV